LKGYDANVTIYDPWANPEEVRKEYGLSAVQDAPQKQFDAVLLAVAHSEFENVRIQDLCKPGAVVYDVKGVLGKNGIDGRL
jgi:UDP-N-acetyl-D-galactosamine dehydrogenase